MRYFFKDLLKVNDPEKQGQWHFSQARVYLFGAVLIIFTLSIMSFFTGGDNKDFQFALDTVFWLALFFGSYALVGKGMKYYHLQQMMSGSGRLPKKINSDKPNVPNDENQELS